jgi:hypothetical protein
MDNEECGGVGGINIGRVNRSTWGTAVAATLRLPQIPYDRTLGRTGAADVGSRRLTA